MPHGLRKSQLIAFDMAVAGHDGVLSHKTGELLVKPCKPAEIEFYQSTPSHPALQPWIPHFYGEFAFNAEATAQQQQQLQQAAASAATISVPGHASQPSTGPLAPTTDAPSRVHHVPSSSSQSHHLPVSIQPATLVPLDPPRPPSLSIADSTPAAAVAPPWTPSEGAALKADKGVVLENVAAGFRRPNILDVKLGARLWADDAPLVKRQKLDREADATTSRPLGYRIAGMKTWAGPQPFNTATESSNGSMSPSAKGRQSIGSTQGSSTSHPPPDLSGYRRYDKAYGRTFQVHTVARAFREYFVVDAAGVTHDLARQVVHLLLEDLTQLQQVIAQQESRIYSSSLLFVYEGDGQALRAALEDRVTKAALKPDTRPGEASSGHVQAVSGNANTQEAEEVEDEVNQNDDDDEEEEEEEEDEDEDGIPEVKTHAIKLIDFAHALWTPGQGPDENMLMGIGNVIQALQQLLDEDEA